MNLTDRKESEINFYDKRYLRFEKELPQQIKTILSGTVLELSCTSARFVYEFLEKECPNKVALDFGCGLGANTFFMTLAGAKKAVGLDLSEQGIAIAERIKTNLKLNNAEFVVGDCEKTPFPDNYFDLILDYGTLSSLDLEKGLQELNRILKPSGKIILLETFGHHPIGNLKRKVNLFIRRRTHWAVSHILTMASLKRFEEKFASVEIHFFHLASYFTITTNNKWILPFRKILQLIDGQLLKIPAIRKYGFKIVAILAKPIRS